MLLRLLEVPQLLQWTDLRSQTDPPDRSEIDQVVQGDLGMRTQHGSLTSGKDAFDDAAAGSLLGTITKSRGPRLNGC